VSSRLSRLPLIVVIALFFISRIVLFPVTPVEPDTVPFILAVDHYSMADGNPPLPGFYLQVLCTQVAAFFVESPNRAFLIIHLLLGFLGLLMVYRTAKLLSSRAAGLAAAFLYLANPMIAYAGITGIQGNALCAISATGGYLLFRYIRDKRGVSLFRVAVVLGLTGGFSPLAEIALLPFFIFVAFWVKPQDKSHPHPILVFAIASLIWFVPTISNAGSLGSFLQLISHALDQSRICVQSETAGLLLELPALLILNIGLPLVFAGLIAHLRRTPILHRGDNLLFALWVVPGLVFTLYFVWVGRGPIAAYFLFAPVFVFFSICVNALGPDDSKRGVRVAVIALLSAFPGILSFYTCNKTSLHDTHPFHFTRQSVHRADSLNLTLTSAIRDLGSAGQDAVLLFPPCSQWDAEFFRVIYPDAEIHSLSGQGACHEVYQYGRSHQAYDNIIELRRKRIFILGRTAEFRRLGIDEEIEQETNPYSYYISEEPMGRLALTGCKVTMYLDTLK